MSGDVTVRDDKFTMPGSDVEVKAIFEEDAPPTPTEYTVTFDGNDGTPSVGSITTTKQKLTSLPDASRSKHSFNGWYTEPVGGSRVTTATVFTGDTTIYAQWTAKSSSASPTAPTLPVTGGPALQKHLGTLLVAGILVTLVVVAAV